MFVRQSVPCRGGGAVLGLWQPPVNLNAGQMLSLSQIRVFGSGGSQLQTVEVGWCLWKVNVAQGSRSPIAL